MQLKIGLLLVAATLAACEDLLPMAAPEADLAGKQMASPPPGMAALYVYRERAGNTASISVGSLRVGPLQGRTWLRVDLEPGSHDVRCILPSIGTETAAVVDLRGGEIAYLSAAERFTPFWACHMTRETVAAAKPAILAGSRIRELK